MLQFYINLVRNHLKILIIFFQFYKKYPNEFTYKKRIYSKISHKLIKKRKGIINYNR